MISDAEGIRELLRRLIGFDYSSEMFEENIRKLMATPTNIILVAENNNQMLGFVHACDFPVIYGPQLKFLSAIAVDENYRRYGVAKKLLDGIEAWAHDTGASGIRLYSGSERIEAVSFYKACGYEFVKSEYQFKKDF